jgi:SAM-dependent methyltransferase
MFEIVKTQDTRNGKDIWVAKLTKRLSSNDYNVLSTKIKKLGGYWSRFVDGFLFKIDPTELLAEFGEEKSSDTLNIISNNNIAFFLDRPNNVIKEENILTIEEAKIKAKKSRGNFGAVELLAYYDADNDVLYRSDSFDRMINIKLLSFDSEYKIEMLSGYKNNSNLLSIARKILTLPTETLQGGKADKLNISDIAKKHNVKLDYAKKQLERGTQIEVEHTSFRSEAIEIALDHLFESIEYYNELNKMESNLEEQPMTLDEFNKKLPDIESPFSGENGIIYKAKYDKYSGKTMYFKYGRSNSTKISVVAAYKNSYLYLFKKSHPEYKAEGSIIYKFPNDEDILSLVVSVDNFPEHTFNAETGEFTFESEVDKLQAIKLVTEKRKEEDEKFKEDYKKQFGRDVPFEKITSPYELGKQAFHAGKKRILTSDPEMMDLLKGKEVGDPQNIKDMEDWINGWDEENLKAPIPGWSKEENEKLNLSRTKNLDNLHPLDLWVQFSDGRFYRKFQFTKEQTQSGIVREITDRGIKESMEDRPDGGLDAIISVKSEIETNEISNLFMELTPIETTIKPEETEEVPTIIPETPKQNTDTNVPEYAKPKKQDDLNTEIRRLLDTKGDKRFLYTKNELLMLADYTGDSKTQEESSDGYLWDYYTPDELVRICWQLAYKYGFKASESKSVLEPSCGVGRFLRYCPDYVKATGFDIDKYSSMITKLLYPMFNIINDTFESNFYIKTGLNSFDHKAIWDTYDLVIGNPPYMYPYTSVYKAKELKIHPYIQSLEQWFIARGIDSLKKNGLLIYIVPSTILDNKVSYSEFKEAMFKKANMIDAYRIPARTFTDTDVTTDIIVLQKK